MQPALIPAHEMTLTSPGDEMADIGWVRAYRGAEIRSNPKDTVHSFRLAGHPFDGHGGFGQLAGVKALIDRWLDTGTLPPPYVWPPK